jgi:2,5-diketo-D-gluconate reductase B
VPLTKEEDVANELRILSSSIEEARFKRVDQGWLFAARVAPTGGRADRMTATCHSALATFPPSHRVMTDQPTLSFSREAGAIPVVGFGTSPLTGGLTAETVLAALSTGYRHIDTARKYGTEPAVGEAMRASGIPRGDIFLTTKVSHENLRAGDFARSVDDSLRALKVDYVDLLLVHWPNQAIALAETMQALAQARRQGLARHIGVANFNIGLLDQAVALCPEPLVALQAEYHPYLDQSKLLAAARRHRLVFIAYCPLARGRLFGDPVLDEIAATRGRSVAQIALRWLLQQNVAAIPFSSKPERIAGNFDVLDFTLDDDEMERILALRRADGRVANPTGRVPGGWD